MNEFDKQARRGGAGNIFSEVCVYSEGIQDLLRPLQHVDISHRYVELENVLVQTGIWSKLTPASRRKLQHARVVLGVAICKRTRCIVATTLSPTLSDESVLRLIEMAISDDVYGAMETLFIDNGTAFNNAEVLALLHDLKIGFNISPSGLPHLRGVAERMFRKLDEQVISQHEGSVFSNIAAKINHHPAASTNTTVEELERVLMRLIVEQYHTTPLVELQGESPRDCYLRLTKKFGVRPPDRRKLRKVFGASTKSSHDA